MSLNHQVPQPETWEAERMKALSDEVFGFAATLLIITITLPKVPVNQAAEALPGAILSDWRNFAIYAVSFLNIGSYWIKHNMMFAYVQRVDRVTLWLNMLLLLSVTFLPYPTALMGRYGRDSVTASVYGITISLNYFFLFLLSWYLYSKDQLLNPELDPEERSGLRIRVVWPLLIAILGTTLSFYYVRLSFLFYFLVMLINTVPVGFWAKVFPQRKK